MKFSEFIGENKLYVISYDCDCYLEDSGFDFKVNNDINTLEYFKMIKYRDRLFTIVFTDEREIYIRKMNGKRVEITGYMRDALGEDSKYDVVLDVKTDNFAKAFIKILDKIVNGEIKYIDPF